MLRSWVRVRDCHSSPSPERRFSMLAAPVSHESDALVGREYELTRWSSPIGKRLAISLTDILGASRRRSDQ